MGDPRPTWRLVLDAARSLERSGTIPFKLAQLVAEVQHLDAGRQPNSIHPVVQGMTMNAGKGPASPCGKVLERVQHGYYRLLPSVPDAPDTPMAKLDTTSAPERERRRPRRPAIDVERRLADLITSFDEYVDRYDRAVPFRRSGQYELHRRTIDRRRRLGSVQAAIADREFIDLLHATLQRWGIGRRASRLVTVAQFRQRLAERADELTELEGRRLDDPGLDIATTTTVIDDLITTLGVVENQARIVAGTKTLHHLLPDLVPPMDRAWTGAFFGWNTIDPSTRQTAIFHVAFGGLAQVARAVRPSRLVGAGWRTSATKVLDNALIGYCQANEIGP